jgi:hypothetical protein
MLNFRQNLSSPSSENLSDHQAEFLLGRKLEADLEKRNERRLRLAKLSQDELKIV